MSDGPILFNEEKLTRQKMWQMRASLYSPGNRHKMTRVPFPSVILGIRM